MDNTKSENNDNNNFDILNCLSPNRQRIKIERKTLNRRVLGDCEVYIKNELNIKKENLPNVNAKLKKLRTQLNANIAENAILKSQIEVANRNLKRTVIYLYKRKKMALKLAKAHATNEALKKDLENSIQERQNICEKLQVSTDQIHKLSEENLNLKEQLEIVKNNLDCEKEGFNKAKIAWEKKEKKLNKKMRLLNDQLSKQNEEGKEYQTQENEQLETPMDLEKKEDSELQLVYKQLIQQQLDQQIVLQQQKV